MQKAQKIWKECWERREEPCQSRTLWDFENKQNSCTNCESVKKAWKCLINFIGIEFMQAKVLDGKSYREDVQKN